MEYRTEKDSLGDAARCPGMLYFGVQTQRAVENFPVSGLRALPKLIWATAVIKKAAAMTNRELGKLAPSLAGTIIKSRQTMSLAES